VKKYILLTVACLLCVPVGCATKAALKRVQGDVNGKIEVTNENARLLKEDIAGIRSDLKGDIAGIRSDLKNNGEAISVLRTKQDEIGADVTSLRDSIRKLTEATEALSNDISAAKKNVNLCSDDIKALEGQLDAVSFKTNYLENFLDIGDTEGFPEARKKGAKQASRKTVKRKMEAAYMAAYGEFREGRHENARTHFQNFLKQYPHTEYSDNAQFWIGESYYSEKNYEKAVLEYDKVAKNYPTGDRVPYALLKQGLSFLNLGNKTSSSLILQQLIKNYPNTNQARIARETLLGIK
jgi:tol-pal system protein YbgF